MKYQVKRVIYFAELENVLNNPPAGYELYSVLPFADTEMHVVIWQTPAVSGSTLTVDASALSQTRMPKKGASK